MLATSYQSKDAKRAKEWTLHGKLPRTGKSHTCEFKSVPFEYERQMDKFVEESQNLDGNSLYAGMHNKKNHPLTRPLKHIASPDDRQR